MGTQGSHLLRVLIYLPVNVKCLLKEFSSGRKGGVPRGDILISLCSPTLSPTLLHPHTTSFSPFERTQIDLRTAQIRLFPSISGALPAFLIGPMSLFSRPPRTLITFSQPTGSEWPDRQVRSPANNAGSGEDWGWLRALLLDSLFAICGLFSFSWWKMTSFSLAEFSFSQAGEDQRGRSDSESETHFWIWLKRVYTAPTLYMFLFLFSLLLFKQTGKGSRFIIYLIVFSLHKSTNWNGPFSTDRGRCKMHKCTVYLTC